MLNQVVRDADHVILEPNLTDSGFLTTLLLSDSFAKITKEISVKIGELARRFGLKPSAIRFYELKGLLPAPPRSGGARDYPVSAVGRLRLVRSIRDAGFSLMEVAEVLSIITQPGAPVLGWKAIARRKVSEIDLKLRLLTKVKRTLQRAENCNCQGNVSRCQLVVTSAKEGNE